MATPGRLLFAPSALPQDNVRRPSIVIVSWGAVFVTTMAAVVIALGWDMKTVEADTEQQLALQTQVGTALGLALSAVIAAALTPRGPRDIAKIAICIASLLTFVIGLLGILDLALVTAFNASVAFIIFGTGMFVAQSLPSQAVRHYVTGVTGAAATTLGAAALVSHAIDLSTGYMWTGDTPLSLAGSLGLVAAGFSAMASIVFDDSSSFRRSFTSLALAILTSGMTVSSLAGSALYSSQIKSEKQLVRLVANNVARYLERAIRTDLLPLETMAAQWRTNGRIPETEWRAQADFMLETIAGLRAVLWIDADIIGRRVAPTNLPGVWTGRKFEAPVLVEYGRRIMNGTEPSLYPVFDGVRGRSFSTLMPVYDHATQDGLLLTVIDSTEWGEAVLQELNSRTSITITDSTGTVYNNGVEGVNNGMSASIAIKVGEEQWRITATETEAMFTNVRSSLPQTVTALGIILTLLLYTSTLIAQTSIRRAKALTGSNARLESEISARQGVQNKLEKEIRNRLDTEAVLKTDRERLDLALGAGGTGTWHLDPETGALAWDQKMIDLFGFEDGTFDGTYDTFESVVLSEDLPRIEKAMERAWETGDEFEEDFRIQRNDEVRLIYGKARVVTTPDGNQKIMIGINQDVTERRRAEKLSTLGTLAAGFAHELNNPLMGCVNYVAYAARKTENARALDALSKAETEIKRVIRVVQDMLSFSRFREDFSAETKVSNVVDRAFDLVVTSYHANGVEFENRVDVNMAPVAMSEDALQQVLLNLLVNAGHAVEASETRTVFVDADQDERRVYVSVTDSGCGIPEDIRPRLFEPFFTTKKAGKGSGLGLSISFDIVNRFGGNIDYESTVGVGTTFTLIIPKAS
ncbi:MAG: PAS domain-containing protein [Alphaproteobacteria bacterium]|nr:PAS domain-containing protein [Alphaproteobacteria bacterium]